MRHASFVVTAVGITILACGSSSNQEHVGAPCAVPGECYPTLDGGAIHGTVTCLTKYPGGYCTHTCTADADCCAVAGECKTGFKQLCAPLENQPQQYCFLSCEAADIAAAPNQGVTDPNAYCARFFYSGATCRSTGGGSNNRKFCG
jgi:hypothetical protein